MPNDQTKPILDQGFEACAEGLTDFGYGGVTPEMVKASYARWKRGEEPADVIERFAFGNFEEYPSIFGVPVA